MVTINNSQLKDEHNYCPHCGGLVNFKECRVLLVSPPIRQYYCSSCHKVAISIRGD
uniref:Uncharacterized protein n=1 Tax=Klebsiella phage FKP3 TaxID=3231233 RepID=A0AAU8HZS2_9CAUD